MLNLQKIKIGRFLPNSSRVILPEIKRLTLHNTEISYDRIIDEGNLFRKGLQL